MNKIISDSLILLLISFLLITLGGCAEKQNAEDEETGEEIQGGTAGEMGEESLVELQYEPKPVEHRIKRRISRSTEEPRIIFEQIQEELDHKDPALPGK